MMKSLTQLTVLKKDNSTTICLAGRLDAQSVTGLWRDVIKKIPVNKAARLTLDLEKVEYLDSAGAMFVCHFKRFASNKGINKIYFSNLKPEYSSLIELAGSITREDSLIFLPEKLTFFETKGKQVSDLLKGTKEFISYIGEIFWALVQSLLRPKTIRWSDTFLIAERSGVDALPIVALISFIVGLVMAFQAAIPMKMFGAELYVSNLIGIAMIRELGPLMTAIVLAGRSSSAFAAEIGTMRINEEIDALTVMGIDPIKFLIVPRIIASVVITPLLTIFSNLVGILGGALVITSMGYPIIAYYNQIASFVKWNDFTGGMIKCVVFGLLIAISGCIRGYQTQSGSSAVGISTTRAVVTGIVLIAIFDGMFSITFYYLGI